MSEGQTGRLESALAGRYKIQRKLGEGGMASVYLAQDLKHERNVALKILKPELAAVIGAERFLAEIKTTANLQHPHILPLFDSGEADGFLYYVMPYIDGETLAQKLARERQLGVTEAVKIASQVADALDYAHRNDVLHRDIKPGNILLHDGRPVVADFGIAVAISAAGGGRMTETGLSLGTPHYMSPEQASADRDLNARSDVYSLGCVLYEMIAGQPPHTGPSAQSILVRILTESPRPLTEMRHTVPPHVAAAVAKAIEKLPADRFESARDFMEALEDTGFTYTPAAPTRAAAAAPAAPVGSHWFSDWRSKAMVTAAVVTTVLAVYSLFGRAQPEQRVQRYAIDTEGYRIDARHKVMISPDGRRLAVGTRDDDGALGLYWREIGEERFQRLDVGGAPFYPTFSPDGDWLAYVDGGGGNPALMRVSLSGGAPRAIVPGGHEQIYTPGWSADGTIAYGSDTGIWAVPGTGGEPRQLMAGGNWAVQPRLLPGGAALTYTDRRDGSTYVLDLASDSSRLVVTGGIDATYVATGHLLFVDPQGGLWAQPFDVAGLETTGDAVPMISGIAVAGGGWTKYSISDDGTLVYGIGAATGGGAPDERFMVGDLAGDGTLLGLEPRDLAEVAWAPDGETLAFESGGSGTSRQSTQIFTYNTVLGDVPRPLTFEDASQSPEWSPDGTRIVFSRVAEGTDGDDLFVKTFGDDAPPELLLSLPGDQFAYDWPTEDVILFQNSTGSGPDIWVYDFGVDSAYAYLTSEDALFDPVLSPDGSLVAYTEFGQVGGIFVRSFPTPRQRELVTRPDGGTVAEPRWSPDGNTIYYWRASGGANTLLAARIRREPSFAVTATDTLYTSDGLDRSAWDLHPDGDRLIIPVRAEAAATADGGGAPEPERFVVAVNWFGELRAIMGGGS